MFQKFWFFCSNLPVIFNFTTRNLRAVIISNLIDCAVFNVPSNLPIRKYDLEP